MLIKADRVAEQLEMPLQRVYAMARAGIFPAGVIVRFGNRQIRFDDENLRKWVKAGGTAREAGVTDLESEELAK